MKSKKTSSVFFYMMKFLITTFSFAALLPISEIDSLKSYFIALSVYMISKTMDLYDFFSENIKFMMCSGQAIAMNFMFGIGSIFYALGYEHAQANYPVLTVVLCICLFVWSFALAYLDYYNLSVALSNEAILRIQQDKVRKG